MLQSNIMRDFFFDNVYAITIISSLIVCTVFSFAMSRSYNFRLRSKKEKEIGKRNDVKKSVDRVLKKKPKRRNR